MLKLLSALLDPNFDVQPVTNGEDSPLWVGQTGQGVVDVRPMDAGTQEVFGRLLELGFIEEKDSVTVWGQPKPLRRYRFTADDPKTFATVIDKILAHEQPFEGLRWYCEAQLPNFDDQTPYDLVNQGRDDAVIDYFERWVVKPFVSNRPLKKIRRQS